MTPEQFYDQMKDYYCIVENQRQADELHRLCKEVCPDIVKGNISLMSRFNYFLIIKDPKVRTFTNDSNTYFDEAGRKIASNKLSYSEMVTKIKSLNMKKDIRDYCIEIKTNPQKAAAEAYLKQFFIDEGLDIKIHPTVFSLSYPYNYCWYCSQDDAIHAYARENDFNKQKISIEEFADLLEQYKNQTNKFVFPNGLEAKYNKSTEHVIIGCKNKPKGYFENLANNVVSMNVSFGFGGFKFEIEDAKKFAEWLKSL